MKTAFRFLSLILFSASALLHAAERRALVIGNKDYTETGTFADLDTTLNDATVMRTLLGKAGFKLAPAAENLTRIAMMDALIDFRDSLQEGDEAVVYFAGHGLEYQKNVYLMGTNAEGRLKAQLEAEGISEATISATLAEKNIKLAILLLDCCREIPDASWLSADPSTRSRRGGGAAAVTPPPNVIVGYATSGGRFTNDSLSSADRNGPLVAALKTHWDSGEVFELMWKDVAADVFTASQAAVKAGTAGEIQMPSIYGQTVHRFSFMAKGATPPAQVAKMVPTVPPSPTPLPPPSSPAVREMVPQAPTVVPPSSGKSVISKTELISRGNRVGEVKSVILPGGVEMKMVWCPAGKFTMSSPQEEVGRDDTFEDEVQVTLTYGFWIAQTECTQLQWHTIMRHNPSHFEAADMPVQNVSWEDAQAYLAKLNANNASGQNWIWALPTEAQWEYACRAGTTTPTSFGQTLTSAQANFDGTYPYGLTGTGVNLGKPVKVGSHEPNNWGLFDMHGNVKEWCEDRWGSLTGMMDPLNRGELGLERVCRGGGWADRGEYCRSASRIGAIPSEGAWDLGFRLALVPEGTR